MAITLTLTPSKAALLAGRDNRLDVLVRAAAPNASEDAPARRSLNLALVIDRSGSMAGEPLNEAKRCAVAIVDRLRPEDFVSVVAYDNEARIVRHAGPAAKSAPIKAAIADIREGGSTALHDGWAAGAEQAAMHVARAGVSRVLLLSDGCANAGLTDPDAIARHCAAMAAAGVSTSTYGLGQNFNEDLMIAMARAGGGIDYYGQSAADLMEKFQQEFDLLQALYAHGPRLRLVTPVGVDLKVLNDLTFDGQGAWRLTDIAHGAEAWAVVRLKIPAALAQAAEAGAVELLSASLAYEAQGREERSEPARLTLRAAPRAQWEAMGEDELVVRRVREVRFARYQREAAAAARAGDWAGVERVLEKARALARDNPWLAAALPALEAYAARQDRERFAKEATFKAQRMTHRLAAQDEPMHFAVALEAARPSFLRRRTEEGRSDEAGDE